MQLAALDTAHTVQDMAIPGFRLYRLKGADDARWSIWVSGNWRVTFVAAEGRVHDVDYEDYQ